MDYEELLRQREKILNQLNETSDYLDAGSKESERVSNELKKTRNTLDDLDRIFIKKTGLTDVDVILLFVAIGLQITRQYLFSNEKLRLNANQGDKFVETVTPAKWQDVLLQSVPYDAIKTSSHVFETGLGGSTHRYRTLGHDPLLGWIFGTANIMTNSLTKTNLETYQVKDMRIIRHYPMGVAGMMDRAVYYGMHDPRLMAISVVRQAVHFGSDFFTKQGLPIPIISTVDNDLAKNMLMKWHIDTYSIVRGAVLSAFINNLISFIHRLFFVGENEMDEKLYEVRTRKILLYSNLVATSSNSIVVGITRDFTKLDIGGVAVTIYRLITDKKFIKKVKEEFVFGSYRDIIIGNSVF